MLTDSLVLRESLEIMVLREILVLPDLLDPLVLLDLRFTQSHTPSISQFINYSYLDIYVAILCATVSLTLCCCVSGSRWKHWP